MVTAASQVVNSKSRLRFMITTGWSSTRSVVTFCKVQTLEGWFNCLFDPGFGLIGRLALDQVKLQLVGDGWMLDGHCCIPSCKFQESFAIYDHDWLVFNS